VTKVKDKIENCLGRIDKLPRTPFLTNCKYTVFPSTGEDLIDQKLYEILFCSNKELGNKRFLAKSCLDVKGKSESIIEQLDLDWDAFDSFQGSAFVYEGFYMTSENYDWLGIYHQDGYTVIGSNDKFTEAVTQKMYGQECWKDKLEEAFNNGFLDMYENDYRELISALLN
jgi:hypothetical protein